MQLREFFLKPVERKIEGVIKADDDQQLRTEFEEYVVTNEIAKALEPFLEAYTDPAVKKGDPRASGVWISGFFGSGKSHLLKILAHLLANRKIDGTYALDYFKPKVEGNAILGASLAKAVGIASESILFNIDQKAEIVTGESGRDALLGVFVKVFYEHMGFYGRIPWVGAFEHQLAKEDKLEAFKKAVEKASGKPWADVRKKNTRYGREIDEAYNKVTDQREEQVAKRFSEHYSMSIEDFAEEVLEYIETRDKDFRLNFFVDEVGQYIANDTKLMTNLQTLSESLATRCRGRAWILVTSQNDMARTLGDLGKQQSNDFSKIQARFLHRMILSSANVNEVIQRRLLEKNEKGRVECRHLHKRQTNNFGTLFSFTDGSKEYKVYRDEQEFTASYPFVPYQFLLFQEAISKLSEMNAFEGKFGSVGERSMLGVFQDAAVQILDQKAGSLASFDRMYAGIEKVLKTSVTRGIKQAERQLSHPMALRLLKALFLVRYVKGFRATLPNLRVLMLDDFEQDLGALDHEIREALDVLERNTYIQRNQDLFEFLTNEEQDVENEIKQIVISEQGLEEKAAEILFDRLLNIKRVRHTENGHEFEVARKVNGRLLKRDQQIALDLILPLHREEGDMESLLMRSTEDGGLLMALPEAASFTQDLERWLQTDVYCRRSTSSSMSESKRRIVQEKMERNGRQEESLEDQLRELANQATYICAGRSLQLKGDLKLQAMKALSELIDVRFPQLRQLHKTYTEQDVRKELEAFAPGFLKPEETELTEAENSVLNKVRDRKRQALTTTVKSLLDDLEQRPYGWPKVATQCMLARLLSRGSLILKWNGDPVLQENLEEQLSNSSRHDKSLVELMEEATPQQINTLRAFVQNYFDRRAEASDLRGLSADIFGGWKKLLAQCDTALVESGCYPFLDHMKPAVDQLRRFADQDSAWLLKELPEHQKKLLDNHEQLIAPRLQFMNGKQREIYDNAARLLQDATGELQELDAEQVDHLRSALADPECFRKMPGIKSSLEELERQLDHARVEARKKANEELDELLAGLKRQHLDEKLSPEQWARIEQAFSEQKGHLTQQTIPGLMRDQVQRFRKQLPGLTGKDEPGYPKGGIPPHQGTDTGDTDPDTVWITPQDVPFDKQELSSEQDVEDYLKALGEALRAQLSQGKRLRIR